MLLQKNLQHNFVTISYSLKKKLLTKKKKK